MAWRNERTRWTLRVAQFDEAERICEMDKVGKWYPYFDRIEY